MLRLPFQCCGTSSSLIAAALFSVRRLDTARHFNDTPLPSLVALSASVVRCSAKNTNTVETSSPALHSHRNYIVATKRYLGGRQCLLQSK